MEKDYVLITGANGEIGHSLINQIFNEGHYEVIAIDINPLDQTLVNCCCKFIQCNILDEMKLTELFSTYHFSTIYHLASILSTRAETNPLLAQKVNVQGTVNLLELAAQQTKEHQKATKFIYPSSIAVYGFSTVSEKHITGKVNEFQSTAPITMYGVNKLSCENVGVYYANHYRLLENDDNLPRLDFRAIRFPGLISAFTTPTGGTSDYGPEMLHQAAQNKPYNCFVRPDSKLPFMVMPDAVKSLIGLAKAPISALSQHVYNVTSFTASALELEQITKTAFPNAQITYAINKQRQQIVDSWPEDIDDSAARKDWDWQPDYDRKRAFEEYLIPNIKQRYLN